MPKPVLSDSLFNADDVATAVLAEANLQITNSDLGVVNRSTEFSYGAGFSTNNHDPVAYSFNGFMFVSLNCKKQSNLQSGDVVVQVSNSDYRPITRTSSSIVSHEGDLAFCLDIKTSGNIEVSIPVNPGGSTFHIATQFFYRYA